MRSTGCCLRTASEGSSVAQRIAAGNTLRGGLRRNFTAVAVTASFLSKREIYDLQGRGMC